MTIVKTKKGYKLKSKKTGKNLGTSPTLEGAKAREKQVTFFKNMKKYHEDHGKYPKGIKMGRRKK